MGDAGDFVDFQLAGGLTRPARQRGAGVHHPLFGQGVGDFGERAEMAKPMVR